MTHSLFGTDGIRGTAGAFPLDAPTVRRVGAALVKALPHSDAKLLVGRDTRESGTWIERELAHGARTAGATVHSIGVAPTPAVAYLTGSLDFDAAVTAVERPAREALPFRRGRAKEGDRKEG